MKACENGHVEIVSQLLLHGADVNVKNAVRSHDAIYLHSSCIDS